MSTQRSDVGREFVTKRIRIRLSRRDFQPPVAVILGLTPHFEVHAFSPHLAHQLGEIEFTADFAAKKFVTMQVALANGS